MFHHGPGRPCRPAFLVRILDRESVLLNIETEQYFGLDETGTRMWQLVTASPKHRLGLPRASRGIRCRSGIAALQHDGTLNRSWIAGCSKYSLLMWERFRRFKRPGAPGAGIFSARGGWCCRWSR